MKKKVVLEKQAVEEDMVAKESNGKEAMLHGKDKPKTHKLGHQ